MTGTKTETKTSTTKTTVKRVTLNPHAQKSLGILVVTESGMREAWNAAQQQRAVVAFDAYVLSVGLLAGGSPLQGKAIASLLGTTPGNVSALIRAGAILNRAGAHAASIGSESVTVCQNSNAKQTAHLDSLTGKALADAVKRMSRAVLDGKATAHRAPQPDGKGKGKGADKGKGTEATDVGRASVAAQNLRAVKSDAVEAMTDADAKAVRLAVESARVECDRILAALTSRPTVTVTPKP